GGTCAPGAPAGTGQTPTRRKSSWAGGASPALSNPEVRGHGPGLVATVCARRRQHVHCGQADLAPAGTEQVLAVRRAVLPHLQSAARIDRRRRPEQVLTDGPESAVPCRVVAGDSPVEGRAVRRRMGEVAARRHLRRVLPRGGRERAREPKRTEAVRTTERIDVREHSRLKRPQRGGAIRAPGARRGRHDEQRDQYGGTRVDATGTRHGFSHRQRQRGYAPSSEGSN